MRLVSNDYGTPDCPGTITMLQYLALNGADVRFFTTTTYVHAKYQSIDNGRKAAVSSINWSKTSMTKNREAGALLDGGATETAAKLASYMQSVFVHDFDKATPLVPGEWSAEELAVITDPAAVPIVLPDITFPEAEDLYQTAVPRFTYNPNATTTIQASPDSAWATIKASLNGATESVAVAMYQVTSDELCDEILDLKNRGVNVSLMVSSRIYAADDCAAAQQCYAKLNKGGLEFMKSSTDYSYSQ